MLAPMLAQQNRKQMFPFKFDHFSKQTSSVCLLGPRKQNSATFLQTHLIFKTFFFSLEKAKVTNYL
jgi:hypothetical protein